MLSNKIKLYLKHIETLKDLSITIIGGEIMDKKYDFMSPWLELDRLQNKIRKEVEAIIRARYQLSLKEFYVLYYISVSPEKKLRLQELQNLLDLSQSALSRIVSNMESEKCGALEKCVCAVDRRGTYTQITEWGEEKLQGSLDIIHDVMSKYLGDTDANALMHQLVKSL
ncbi:MarR family transcriptional regulator [Staphylococcus gallinarum]|uniref:MarR family transcriptional regulator n=2 Tax=Staphylococcus gallinarum TaxID=1293 RepID=A0A418HNZ8_STAGA|nr:MarR family winged helix-turn-helix transcriptional regulator [Staphylococcus gallinarum]PTE75104.1 MarR family transcriptional regulator [Staphylococcus gallinarum]RIL43200.1 MarR family transcriptional regulator [Staphylococcus gallinarum]RIO93699.1 MarR family transcriptional regulator [Staphylococcus gallinarum]